MASDEYSPLEYFGTITDGKYKLDIAVKNVQDKKALEFHLGTKLQITGDLQIRGNLTTMSFFFFFFFQFNSRQ